MRITFPKGSLLIVSLLLFQCSDDAAEIPDFSGITETNSMNELVGKMDETDWQLDEKWSSREMELFSDLGISNLNNSNIDPAELEVVLDELFPCPSGGRTRGVCDEMVRAVYVYPNPAAYFTNLQFSINDSGITSFKLVIVNQAFDELVSKDEFSTGYSIDFESNGLKPKNTYRAYYLIKTTYSDFVLKGHGDIKVN